MEPKVGDIVKCIRSIDTVVLEGELYTITCLTPNKYSHKNWIGFVMKREYPGPITTSMTKSDIALGKKANWAMRCFKIVHRPGWSDQALKVLFGDSDETR